jgi:hypothetical protein
MIMLWMNNGLLWRSSRWRVFLKIVRGELLLTWAMMVLLMMHLFLSGNLFLDLFLSMVIRLEVLLYFWSINYLILFSFWTLGTFFMFLWFYLFLLMNCLLFLRLYLVNWLFRSLKVLILLVLFFLLFPYPILFLLLHS